tara:strand:- start:2275 stop:2454 length:180 start_codon:yes stop_codon:yes gene_type:complete
LLKKKECKDLALSEGEDYYFENDFMVFTEAYLKKRGYCCKNQCRHCPWEQKPKPQSLKK